MRQVLFGMTLLFHKELLGDFRMNVAPRTLQPSLIVTFCTNCNDKCMILCLKLPLNVVVEHDDEGKTIQYCWG